MYLVIVARPTFTPTCAQTVLTDFASASVSVISPRLSFSSFCNGTPEITTSLRPETTDCGVNFPLSIAAVAVTTLNVEPGA